MAPMQMHLLLPLLVLLQTQYGSSFAVRPLLRALSPRSMRTATTTMTATTTESETDEKPTVVTAELLTSFVTKVYNQEAAAKLDSVEFVLYDDEYVLDHDNNATDASTAGSERETMLFIPGLDFSGVSAIGQYPALASKYELWWCRVESDDRTPFATLADTVAAFVAGHLMAFCRYTLTPPHPPFPIQFTR